MTLKEVGIVIGKKLQTRRQLSGKVIIDFKGAEIKDGRMLISAYGQGKTVAQAKANYCLHLRGKRVVVDAMTKTRKEIQLPPKVTVR